MVGCYTTRLTPALMVHKHITHHCKLGNEQVTDVFPGICLLEQGFSYPQSMQISPSFTVLPHQPYTKPPELSHSTAHPLLPDLPAKGESQGKTQKAPGAGTSITVTYYWSQGGPEHSTEHCWTLHYRLKGLKSNLHHQAARCTSAHLLWDHLARSQMFSQANALK